MSDIPEESRASEPDTAMPGFDPRYRNITDYIVRITHCIWEEGDMGYIYETYTPNCTVHTGYGTSYGVEDVVSGSVAFLAALPDRRLFAEDVIWTGDAENGFHTSHLIINTGTNTGYSPWAPPTGKRVNFLAIANCFVKDNRIGEEWLVRDTSALVRQLGLNPRDVALRTPINRPNTFGETDRLQGQAPPAPLSPGHGGGPLETFVRELFHDIFNLRRFNKVVTHHDPDAVLYAPNHSQIRGLGNIRTYLLGLIAMFPDFYLSVEHVYWLGNDSEARVAVRWRFWGTHGKYGWYGPPTRRQVEVLGVSHLHLKDERVTRHYLVFDELALLTQLLGTQPFKTQLPGLGETS